MQRLSIFLVLLVAACAPATQTGAGGSGGMQETTMAAPAILGDYTVVFTEADMPASVPADMRAGSVGTWGLGFHAGNHFVVTQNGTQVVQGAYTLAGDRISFTTDEGQYACNAPATYTWAVSNGQLTFTPVGTDPCEGRRMALTTRAYTRRP